ncbi:aminopeptidase P family protein [Microbacter margulisiae]|uniref:Xaa-Pro aminopeptidase n=1 Tax=Microbacter margulisiae TaxID=1350067 RepID=A0A7W5DRC1_9PORP|nr:aminopeptidase P family protein [Microbacter margulisiae]MBB3187677.1 Xaa-Pro aminopeptidase [Microbacter margulisiae]
MFNKETYIQRRKTLAGIIGSGVILLPGNDESPMNYADNGYHFRQDSTFLYYFGIDFPSLVAIIDIDNDREIIFGDDYTIDDIVWMGPQPTISERASLGGITDVRPVKELTHVVTEVIRKGHKVHFLPPYRSEHMLLFHQLLGLHPKTIDQKASLELVRAVISQREIKTDEEIAEIEKAVDLSVDMHTAAMQIARPGMTEAQIAARVYEIAHSANCEISFPIIATINGQTLHNHYHGNILKSGDLFLLDAGAEAGSHYAGDLSSTFPVDKTFTSQQKLVYEMSLKAHQAAIDALAFNAPFKNVHLAACRSITESMKELGLMKGDTDEAVAAGAHALFIPCGTGHMMGLDVHDMENLGEVWVGYDGEPKSTQFGLKSLRLAKPLQAGHVFTIEPGIYFIPELMDKWQDEEKFTEFINWQEVQKFRTFGGIRNEENYMMTSTGARRLGTKVKPKTVEEVEAIRNQ